jgi:tRNA (guanine-N7-)-methyltransferase
MTQRVIEITSPFFVPEQRLLSGERIEDIFGRTAPMALEIGCGIGDFVVQLAGRDPGTNFLAIDIYNKGCFRTCRRVEGAGLTNVRVMRVEARWLLTTHLLPESLSSVYINCPDPWPKKRHRRRRLVDGSFLRTLLPYMRPGGELFFASDFPDYAEDVSAFVEETPGWRSRLGEPVVTALPEYPISKYMRRFLDLGQPIYHVHACRDSVVPADMAAPELTPGFRMPLRVYGT